MKRLFTALALVWTPAALTHGAEASSPAVKAEVEADEKLGAAIRPFQESGDWEGALRIVDGFIQKNCRSGSPGTGCAGAFHLKALMHYNMDGTREAVRAWEESRSLLERQDRPRALAMVLNNLGQVWYDLGEGARSMDYYGRALLVFQSIGDRQNEASTLNSIGSLLHQRGEYGAALRHFRRSLKICRETGNRYGMGFVLENMGNVLRRAGRYAEAENALRECLNLTRAIGDREGEAYALNSLGAVYYDMQRHREAVAHYEKARALWKDAGRPSEEALGLYNIAVARRQLGEHAAALETFSQVLAVFESTGEVHSIAETQASIAETLLALGRTEEAARYSRMSLEASLRLDVPNLLWEAHLVEAAVARRMGDHGRAVSSMRAAVALIENARGGIGEGGLRSGFMGRNMEAYEWLVEVLLERESAEGAGSAEGAKALSESSAPSALSAHNEAFNVAEKMRARSLLDEIGAARFAREGVPAELMERKRALEARMEWLRKKTP